MGKWHCVIGGTESSWSVFQLQGILLHLHRRRKGSSMTLAGSEPSLTPDEGVRKPCSRQPCSNTTHQKRLPSFESPALSPFLVDETQYIPHSYLCRPVRGLAVGTSIPGDYNPEVLHIPWGILGLENVERSISLALEGGRVGGNAR